MADQDAAREDLSELMEETHPHPNVPKLSPRPRRGGTDD